MIVVHAAGCHACDPRELADVVRLANSWKAGRVRCMACEATYPSHRLRAELEGAS